jgi:hypothetical protein
MITYSGAKRFIGGRWGDKKYRRQQASARRSYQRAGSCRGAGHPEPTFVVIEGSGWMRNRLDVRRGDRVKELRRNPDS